MNLKPRYSKSSLESIFILEKTYTSSFVLSLPLFFFNTGKEKKMRMRRGDEEGCGMGGEEDREAKITESQYHQSVPSVIHNVCPHLLLTGLKPLFLR